MQIEGEIEGCSFSKYLVVAWDGFESRSSKADPLARIKTEEDALAKL